MQARRYFTSFAVVAMLVALTSTLGCRVAPTEETSSAPAEKTREKPGPTLEEFVTAESKMADFSMVTYGEDGEVLFEQTGTLWVTPDRFRYDLYEDGTLIRSVLTPDGETAYFVQHGDQVCEPAVATVASYMAKFNPPPIEAVEDGIDEETGALRMKYDVQETYTVPGASNSWFQDDIVFLIKDDQVVGIITRGHAIDGDGIASPSQTTRRMLTGLEANTDIDDSVFELPYPVQ